MFQANVAVKIHKVSPHPISISLSVMLATASTFTDEMSAFKQLLFFYCFFVSKRGFSAMISFYLLLKAHNITIG